MNKSDKISKIYEVIANKELSLWCKIKIKENETNFEGIYLIKSIISDTKNYIVPYKIEIFDYFDIYPTAKNDFNKRDWVTTKWYWEIYW